MPVPKEENNPLIEPPGSGGRWNVEMEDFCPSNEPPGIKIEGVQPLLRQIEMNKHCFDPFLVSIGPFHYGKRNLEVGNQIKIEMQNQFVGLTGKTKNDLFDMMVQEVEDARMYYDRKAEFMKPFLDNLEKFHQMMFLDGCFFIQFIFTYLRNPVRLSTMFNVTNFVVRDLFILENQLSLHFLEVLMKIRFPSEKEEGVKLMYDFIQDRFPATTILPELQTFYENQHFLDFLHSQLTQQNTSLQHQCKESPCKESPPSDWSSFHSAKELSMIGIYCKPSATNSLNDVKFLHSLVSSKLSLPVMTIDDCTESILLNLVAFEGTPSFQKDQVVTPYLIFMNALVDNVEDVHELRSNGILKTTLSDQEVSRMFGKISRGLVSYSHIFTEVKEQIEINYMNSYTRMFGEWRHKYFSRPWTAFAYIWGLVTFVQAVFEIIKQFHPQT
ncbi:hypothetical protein ACFE04_029590 [Oxalis oulophora]